jgi:hypothetical protein
MPKDLAIAIRCHGYIPVYYDENSNLNEETRHYMFYNSLFDASRYVNNLSIISNVSANEICYGLYQFKGALSVLSDIIFKMPDSDKRTTSQVIDFFFSPHYESRRNIAINNLLNWIFNGKKASITKINHLGNNQLLTYNKIYSRLTPQESTDHSLEGQSGFFYFYSNEMNGREIEQIKTILKTLTDKMNYTSVVYKEEILIAIKNAGFNIDTLYLIDGTCNTMINHKNYTLTDNDLNFLVKFFEENQILKGGKTKRRRKRVNKKRKSKRRNYKHKNKIKI